MNVGEVAALAGVTVRTLHHYDRIGLLSPSGRTSAGYRRYAPADLDRLHSVLLYRALGFSLEEVATLLDDPSADPAEHLRRQHRLLLDRLDRTSAMVAAVEKEMEARAMGISLTPEERFEVFGEHDPAQYDAEVEERWGETGAYAQSKRRTAAYTKDDWMQISAEGEDIEAEPMTVHECDPPRRVVMRSAQPVEDDLLWAWEIDLTEADGTTTLTFAQGVTDVELAESVGPGWDYYLDRMVLAETGGDLAVVDFDDYYPAFKDHYRAQLG